MRRLTRFLPAVDNYSDSARVRLAIKDVTHYHGQVCLHLYVSRTSSPSPCTQVIANMKVPGMLLLLLGVVAYASANQSCNMLQRIKTKMQWAKAYGIGAARSKFGDALWRNVFNYAPNARDIFESVNSKDMASPEFKAHIARVLGGLDRVISMLDNQATLDADLAHLKSQHDPRTIDPVNFVVFRKALIATVAGTFGVCFDVPAWQGCYNIIAKGITGSDIFD